MTGQPDMPTMDEAIRTALDRYVRARNATRSCQRAAEGFTSGKRIHNLRDARKTEAQALQALAGWTEDRARAALCLDGTPPPRRSYSLR